MSWNTHIFLTIVWAHSPLSMLEVLLIIAKRISEIGKLLNILLKNASIVVGLITYVVDVVVLIRWMLSSCPIFMMSLQEKKIPNGVRKISLIDVCDVSHFLAMQLVMFFFCSLSRFLNGLPFNDLFNISSIFTYSAY